MKISTVRPIDNLEGYEPYRGKIVHGYEFLIHSEQYVARLTAQGPAKKHGQLIVAFGLELASQVVPFDIDDSTIVQSAVKIVLPHEVVTHQPTSNAKRVHVYFLGAPNELVVEEFGPLTE